MTTSARRAVRRVAHDVATAPPLRVFFSSGEPSGEMLAVTLAEAMEEFARIAPSGIGADRMRAAGFRITADTTGWASLGPLEAIGKIVPLYLTMWRNAIPLLLRPASLVVMVDFGAFNVRFAKTLRLFGYRGPILAYVPPGAWFDREEQARAVARYMTPLTPFAHQHGFYRGLGLPIAWFGHPLGSLVEPRSPRPVPPPDGGTLALLPGSRRGEIARHLPRLLAAVEALRRTRPRLRVVCSAANVDAERLVRKLVRGHGAIEVVRGSGVLEVADVAAVASGTAVLEAVLREVPLVALYVVSEAQMRIARRIWHRPYVTLPNLLLERAAIPELLQDDCTPERLAARLDELLVDPARQLDDVRSVRTLLGPRDALRRAAAFACVLAWEARRPRPGGAESPG